jgi:transcriptional regulator with XRE-family HTH domain
MDGAGFFCLVSLKDSEVLLMLKRRIRELRNERLLKASDIERITRALADAKQNPDYYISHSTLADIEAGSVPSIFKLFGLAIALRVPLDEILRQVGIGPEEVSSYGVEWREGLLQLTRGEVPEAGFRFQLHFDTAVDTQQTTLLKGQMQEVKDLPAPLQARMDLTRYRYALIGTKDDCMAEILPPGSLAEIDTTQTNVQVGIWRTLQERPIYLVWHNEGHTCCWCQLGERELMLVPHPLSRQLVRRFKVPREAYIIGTVVNAWLPLGINRLAEVG